MNSDFNFPASLHWVSRAHFDASALVREAGKFWKAEGNEVNIAIKDILAATIGGAIGFVLERLNVKTNTVKFWAVLLFGSLVSAVALNYFAR